MKGNRFITICFAATAIALLCAILLTSTVSADEIPVNTTDDVDDGACTTGHCSLREAIKAANTTSGGDRIYFDMGPGPHRISLREDLPMLTDDSTTIEGSRSPSEMIILDGSTGAHVGLWMDSDANVVRYLTIVGFTNAGLAVTGDYNSVEYNIIGIDPEGMLANGNGIIVEGEANTVTDNLISGNRGAGINVIRASNALITGNMIGTDQAGSSDLGNQVGILVTSSESIRIGHAEMNPNLISGNDLYGISLTAGANGIQIVNNKIGTDISGSRALPNGTGISVTDAGGIEIGGAGVAGNLIAGNTNNGILLRTESTVLIIGNEIGKGRVPNGTGVYVGHAPGSVIGNDAAGNKISYNIGDGIFIQNGENLTIFYNDIKHNRGVGIRVQRALDTDRVNIRWNNIGYNRGGKGIQFDAPGTNGGVQPPVLISLTYGSALIGRSCPNCAIDLFSSDLDPSGYGEGKSYLDSIIAGTDGFFVMTIPGVTVCDAITTTATNTDSKTSEFSLTWRGIDCSIPSPIIPILIGLTLVIGISAIPRVWHRPGTTGDALIGIVGIISTIALIIGILFLRFGSLPVGESASGAEEEGQPAQLCANLIDLDKLIPPIGAGFPFEQPPALSWNLLNQPGLPGETRWQVELVNPAGAIARQEVSTPGVPLSSFGIAIDQPGTYRWRVLMEWLDPQAQEWQVYCEDPLTWWFSLGEDVPAPVVEQTQAVETTSPALEPATETPEPQVQLPSARARVNLNCRQGPDERYEFIGNFREGEIAVIEGRNANNTWWYLRPPQAALSCWVLGSGVETSGDLANLPVVTAPLLPTFTFTPTFTPTVTRTVTPTITPTITVAPPQCSDYKTQNDCNAHANDMQCYWSQKNVCVKH